MADTAQPLLTFPPDDYCLVSLMRQYCVCSLLHVFISLFVENREVKLCRLHWGNFTSHAAIVMKVLSTIVWQVHFPLLLCSACTLAVKTSLADRNTGCF